MRADCLKKIEKINRSEPQEKGGKLQHYRHRAPPEKKENLITSITLLLVKALGC